MTSALALREYFLDNPKGNREYVALEEKLILAGTLYQHKDKVLEWYEAERNADISNLPALWDIMGHCYAYNDDIFGGLVMMDLIYEGTITQHTPSDELERLIDEGVEGYTEIYGGSYDYLQMDTELAAIFDEHALPYIIDEQSNLYDAMALYEIGSERNFVANDAQNILFPAFGGRIEFDQYARLFQAGHYVWVGDIRCLT